MITKTTGSTPMPQISKPNSYDGTCLSGSNIDASDVCLWRCGHTRRDGLGDPYRGRTTAIPYSNLHHPIWHSFLSCMRSACKRSHGGLQHTWINLRAQANTISIIDTTHAAKDEIPSPNLLLRAKAPAVLAPSHPPSRHKVAMLEQLLHGHQTA
jgi:hypothetical protein